MFIKVLSEFVKKKKTKEQLEIKKIVKIASLDLNLFPVCLTDIQIYSC